MLTNSDIKEFNSYHAIKDEPHNDFKITYTTPNKLDDTYGHNESRYTNKFKEGLTIRETAMVFFSTIIGGGIVSLPYSFVTAGIFTGVAIHLVVICLMMLSVYLCLRAKDHLGFE